MHVSERGVSADVMCVFGFADQLGKQTRRVEGGREREEDETKRRTRLGEGRSGRSSKWIGAEHERRKQLA